ncbi:MAG TPA: alpha/beta fold hydrolase [Terriglobales bacterium]|nr:alpha/beta fold hydrolase [Terriglobales bacterium]
MATAVVLASAASVLGRSAQQTRPAGATAPTAENPRCSSAAFLTIEQGKLAAVDWVERSKNQVHTRVIETQSHVVDATIDLRSDETAARSSVIVSTAGAGGEGTKVARDLGQGAIYWSPRIPSSLEQAIARARVLDKLSSKIPGASLYSDSRPEITVKRIDSTDWVVGYQDKTYLVLTDEYGCLLSATMPDYGVVIQRRVDFSLSNYPLWPPYAAPPDKGYHAEDVSIRAPQGHVLAGTLTVPDNKENAPAAVLITGLSPHERNQGTAPWMPFRDIADALTRAGIAVLRVDDRGVGNSTGDKTNFTIFDKADDVRTEVTWLRIQRGIDPTRVMLVGYSEGGVIAPMVAAKDSSIAAVIILDGPGVPGMEVATYQVEQSILKNLSIPESDRDKEFAKQLADALKDLTPHESSFLKTDPAEYDGRVRCPALILQGGTDSTVPVRSAERIAFFMRASGNSDVSLRIFPGVSHSLLPDPVGLPSGWAALPAFLTAPDLLDEMTRWSIAKLKGERGISPLAHGQP